jgi:hypothetical protein
MSAALHWRKRISVSSTLAVVWVTEPAWRLWEEKNVLHSRGLVTIVTELSLLLPIYCRVYRSAFCTGFTHKIWLSNKATSLKNNFLTNLLYFCVISFRGNFHRKLHASPYEPSRPEAMAEIIVCCGEGNSDSLSPCASRNKLKVSVGFLFSYSINLVFTPSSISHRARSRRIKQRS